MTPSMKDHVALKNSYNWDKVFKNEPSNICGRQHFTWSILEYFVSTACRQKLRPTKRHQFKST